MDFKQRFLTAMNHEEPDRVPVMGLIAEPATSNRILGRPPADMAGMIRNPETRGMVRDIMNSSWPELVYGNFSDALESAVKMGFDANWMTYTQMEAFEDPRSKDGLICHDICGRVWELTGTDDGDIVLNYIDGLCHTEEEWEAWDAERKTRLDDFARDTAVFHKRLADAHGDRIYPVGYTSMTIFESTW